MKKIIFIILLLSIYSFGQENRTVRMNNLTDSLNTVRASIALKLNTSDTTAQRTFSDLKYPTKTSMQTVDDSLASDIAENKLTTHFFTGTDSIHYGQDSIVVAHGVGSTPTFVVIQLISDGFGFQTWVSGINSLTFYVRRSDTGLKTITSYIKFKWMAYK